MLNDRAVVVVVPAYQEEAHVGRVVATMPGFVDHVVVVDDASVDRTGDVARAAGDSRVRVVRHPARRGVGAAIATGYAEALGLTTGDADAVAVMAGDGQMAPEDLARVVEPIVTGEVDYVKGDRFGEPGVRGAMGLPRWIGGQVFSRLTALAVGQPISDSQCGFTAISRRAITLLDLPGLWPSFGYPNDLLGQLGALGARIAEVPVQPIYGSEISKLRLRHLPPIFFLIARAAMRRGRRGPSGEPGRHPSG
ncbi:MAG: glycosyltransferase family 2 protein [Labilithrix sp.]|nr:glycosyltransferase family 2 protein [Labilithrix sp.]